MNTTQPHSCWKAISQRLCFAIAPFTPSTIAASTMVTITATSIAMTIMALPSMAAYTPPVDASAPDRGSTSTNIVRGGGCTGTSPASLTALAPQHHIGQTASTQPTIVWFTPETDSYTIEFRILEKLGNQQFSPVYSTEFDSANHTNSIGIGHFDLSTTDITLTPGKSYRWQVVVVCNPLFPSESLMTDADLDVMERSIASIPDTLTLDERVKAYAAEGVWYEAMAEAVTLDSEAAWQAQTSLLEDLLMVEQDKAGDRDVDLNSVIPSESTNSSPYIEQLQDVIEALSLAMSSSPGS